MKFTVKHGLLLLVALIIVRQIYIAKIYGNAHLLPFDGTGAANFRHHHLMMLNRAVDLPTALPKYFKWKERMLVEPRSQGQCASCWAFAIADMMADRVSLITRGSARNHLSPQELLSCFRPRWFTCSKGGIPEIALYYVISRGLLKENLYPYENYETQKIQACKVGNNMSIFEAFNLDGQRHEKNRDRIFATEKSIRFLCDDPVDQETIDRNILNMKAEIMTNGPIIGTIYVYDDLYGYDADKVYEVSPGARFMGGHAIEIFGWSDAGANTEEKGFQGAYWICKNHWGTTWPLNLPKHHAGWFYVRMGRNEAGIESRASSAQVLLTEEMQRFSNKSTWLSSAYTSYDQYVNDPERQNFFQHLAQRRRN